ncbi:MAG TPA: hypothetical protein VGN83_12650 [Falsiroseomonas sp.]|jgi:hypothetical protein|nr:hypothetical protein [Falsiroseomonas sp.]
MSGGALSQDTHPVGAKPSFYLPGWLAALLPIVLASAIIVLGGQAVRHYADFISPVRVASSAESSPGPQPQEGAQVSASQASWPWNCRAGDAPDEARLLVCANAMKAGAMHSSVTILLIAFAASAVVANLSIIRESEANRRGTRFVAYGVSLVLLAALTFWFLSGDFLYEGMGGGILGATLLRSDGDWVRLSVCVAYIAAAVGGSFVASGCAAATYHAIAAADAAAAGKDTAEHAALQLGRGVAALQTMTTIGALVLVAGVASVALYFGWAKPFVTDTKPANAYQAMADGIVTLHGAAFTTALFLIFYGGITQLRAGAAVLAWKAEKKTQKDIDAFYSDTGLGFSAPAYLRDALKVAAPLIAATYLEPLSKILAG